MGQRETPTEAPPRVTNEFEGSRAEPSRPLGRNLGPARARRSARIGPPRGSLDGWRRWLVPIPSDPPRSGDPSYTTLDSSAHPFLCSFSAGKEHCSHLIFRRSRKRPAYQFLIELGTDLQLRRCCDRLFSIVPNHVLARLFLFQCFFR